MKITINELIEELEEELNTGNFKYLRHISHEYTDKYTGETCIYISIFADVLELDEKDLKVITFEIDPRNWNGDVKEYFTDINLDDIYLTYEYNINSNIKVSAIKEIEKLFNKIIYQNSNVLTKNGFKNIEDALEYLDDKHNYVTNREILHRYMKDEIDDDHYNNVMIILQELNEYEDTYYFEYDYSAGEFNKPKPLDEYHIADINRLLEEIC